MDRPSPTDVPRDTPANGGVSVGSCEDRSRAPSAGSSPPTARYVVGVDRVVQRVDVDVAIGALPNLSGTEAVHAQWPVASRVAISIRRNVGFSTA